MDKIEAIQRIRTHMIVHHMEEHPHCQYITEALKMALNTLGAIDQIRWERDVAIEQLRDLGIGFGQKTDTANVVTREQYEELRESFVDFVCSGVNNPAPYCKNSCYECVDSRGWCTYQKCRGFNPDGRKYD